MENFLHKKVAQHDNVHKVTTKIEKNISKIKISAQEKIKSKLTLKITAFICILGGVILALIFVTLLNHWSNTHKILWQIPFRTPVWIEEIKPIIKETIIIVTPTPTSIQKFERQGDNIVPIKPQSIIPVKKYLTDDGVKNRVKALAIVSEKYDGDELTAFDNLMKSEAGYRADAPNGNGCGGIPQACPASKMGCPLDNSGVECQTQWAMNYIQNRYGSPIKAWNFWLARVPIDGKDVGNWY